MCGFYQCNSEVLKFDQLNDAEKILFNHYLMRKENLERLKGELPRGQFYLSENTAALDMNVSRSKITRLINYFKEINVIEVVEVFPKHEKKPTLYGYISAYRTEHQIEHRSEHQTEHQSEHQEHSNINALGDTSEHQIEHQSEHRTEHQSEQSKKEYIKKSNEKELSKKKKICVSEEQIESIWALYPNKKGKATAIKKISKLIEQYTYDQLKRAVERYTAEVKQKNVDMQYVKHGDTFFNSGYMDYLDSNYSQEQQLEGHNKFGMYEHDRDYDEIERLAQERKRRLAEERQQRTT